MSNLLETIKQKLEVIEEQRKALVAELQTEFPKLFTELFQKSKLIDSFTWRQYTPYFNDGESCEFRVYSNQCCVNGEDYDELEWYSWKSKYDEYREELKESKDVNIEESLILNEFIEVVNMLPKEFLKDLFGDHVKVTVNRDGTVEVEDYDHD